MEDMDTCLDWFDFSPLFSEDELSILDAPAGNVRVAGDGLGTISQAERRARDEIRQAIQSFAYALWVSDEDNQIAKNLINTAETREATRSQVSHALMPAMEDIEKMVWSATGMCDKRARCAPFRPMDADANDPVWAYKPEMFKPQYPHMHGEAFEYALRCFLPPEGYEHADDLKRFSKFDATLGRRQRPRYSHLEPDAYGSTEDLINMGWSAYDQYKDAVDLTKKIIAETLCHRNHQDSLLTYIHFTHRSYTDCYTDPEGFVDAVCTYFGQSSNYGSTWRPQMLEKIRRRRTLMLNASATLEALKTKALTVRKRTNIPNHSWLVDTGERQILGDIPWPAHPVFIEDVYDAMIDHLDILSASALACTCKTFCTPEMLNKINDRGPTPRVRYLGISADEFGYDPAPFPHARYWYNGKTTAFVSTHVSVKLYVDLVQKELWAYVPVLRNSDNESLPKHKIIEKKDKDEVRPGKYVFGDNPKKLIQSKSYKTSGPRELRNPTYHYKRLDFKETLDRNCYYTARMVFADTKEVVPHARWHGALEPATHNLRKQKGQFVPPEREQTRVLDPSTRRIKYEYSGEPPSALGEFKVHALSRDFQDREFRIHVRLHSSGFVDGEDDVLVHHYYTEPFTVVSRLDRVCPVQAPGAEKRKLRLEKDAKLREREVEKRQNVSR